MNAAVRRKTNHHPTHVKPRRGGEKDPSTRTSPESSISSSNVTSAASKRKIRPHFAHISPGCTEAELRSNPQIQLILHKGHGAALRHTTKLTTDGDHLIPVRKIQQPSRNGTETEEIIQYIPYRPHYQVVDATGAKNTSQKAPRGSKETTYTV